VSLIAAGGAHRGSVRGFYPKTIEGSLRFNDDDSAYLSWTPDETGDSQKKFTLSFWIKRANIEESQIFSIGASTSDRIFLRFDSSHFLDFFCSSGGSTIGRYTTSRVFRDPSSWYHIVVSVDTSLANANSIRIYINGEEDSGSPSTNFNNQSTVFGTQIIHAVGSESWSLGSTILDGYLAEFHCVDNAQLGSDAFGEFKNGVWVAKTPSVTYGTNGFYLNFQDDTAVEAFNTVLWNGDNTSPRSISGFGFQPDLVWVKNRTSGSYGHYLWDAVRGTDKNLRSDGTFDEAAVSAASHGIVSTNTTDGFITKAGSSGSNNVNGTGGSYVAWGWKAGDSNVSNTDGSITSTVRANDTYGFSIVSYTGTGANATVGHGLSTAPSLLIVKDRSTASSWRVWVTGFTGDQYLTLDTQNAVATQTTAWNSTTPTSSVFSLGTAGDTNRSGDSYIAYCWAEKSGYSKFGINTTSRVSCGFKPALVILKDTATLGSWYLLDNTRDADGDFNHQLYGQLSNSEDAPSTSTLTIDDGTAYGNDGGGFTVTWTAQTDRYGTGVIYAAFADTREAAFWLDQSGNDNDWQPVNLDHNDTLLDSPTDNFCTWNPLNKGTNLVTSDGNLSFNNSTTETNHRTCVATHGMTSGKYYWEVQVDSTTNVDMIGIVGQNANLQTHVGGSGFGYGYSTANGNWYKASGWADDGTTPPAFPSGGTIGIAFDADNKKIYFHRDGQWINNANPTAGTGANGTYTGSETVFFPAGSRYYNTGKWTANFGQQPFKYDPPA
jgi:hypothetical protein